MHKFSVGELVRFVKLLERDASIPRGVCEVIRLMPAGQDGDPVYQVVCSEDGLTRVVSETLIVKV